LAFIIRIYHDTWSSEWQIKNKCYFQTLYQMQRLRSLIRNGDPILRIQSEGESCRSQFQGTASAFALLGETSMVSVQTNTRTSPPHLDQEPRLTCFIQN